MVLWREAASLHTILAADDPPEPPEDFGVHVPPGTQASPQASSPSPQSSDESSSGVREHEGKATPTIKAMVNGKRRIGIS
jgi:hypothetical protein